MLQVDGTPPHPTQHLFWCPSLIGALLLLAIAGATGAYQITVAATFTSWTPDGVRGSAFGVARTGLRVAQGVGVAAGGGLAQAIGSAVDTLQTGEAVAIQGVEGAVAPMKVVESVMAAQRSLQTVLAIRDKAVSAYQEIARMAI